MCQALPSRRTATRYVRVINSNKVDSFTTMVTDDVVFLAVGEKPLVGEAAVRAWVDGVFVYVDQRLRRRYAGTAGGIR